MNFKRLGLFGLLAGCLIGLANAEEKELLDRIVAVVNSDIIVDSDLQREMQEVEEELRRQQTPLPPTAALQKQVLERMIVTRLQLQLAEQLSIRVEDEQINEILRNTAKKNNLSLDEFRRTLEQGGHDFKQSREILREYNTIKRLQQRQVVNRINVTEQEVNNFLANQAQQGHLNQEYHVLHILIALPSGASPEIIEEKAQKAKETLAKLKTGADFKETAIAVSDSSQALEGGDLGWRTAGEIPSLFMEDVLKMTEGEIAGPFRNASGFHLIKLAGVRTAAQNQISQTKVRHILIRASETVSDIEAKERLTQLKKRIENGEDFSELAHAHSEHSASAAQGGNLGWINPGEMAAEFETVMNELKTGELSKPFKTQYGWHLMQVLERRTTGDNTDESLRAKAALQIRQRKLEEELQTWLRQLRDEAYIEYRLEE